MLSFASRTGSLQCLLAGLGPIPALKGWFSHNSEVLGSAHAHVAMRPPSKLLGSKATSQGDGASLQETMWSLEIHLDSARRPCLFSDTCAGFPLSSKTECYTFRFYSLAGEKDNSMSSSRQTAGAGRVTGTQVTSHCPGTLPRGSRSRGSVTPEPHFRVPPEKMVGTKARDCSVIFT